MDRLSKRELEIGRLLNPDAGETRPATRGDCIDGERPCPFVACRFHLFIDVAPKTGAVKLNFPDLEVEEMRESCALDVADRGGTTMESVGALMNITRERIRQIEVRALARMASAAAMGSLREYADEGDVGRRRLPVLQGVR